MLTQSQIERIQELVLTSTLGLRAISDRVGVTHQTVAVYAKKVLSSSQYTERFPPLRQPLNAEMQLKIVELLNKTELSFAEIGRIVGCSHTPVAKIARTILSAAQLYEREFSNRSKNARKTHGHSDVSYVCVTRPRWYTKPGTSLYVKQHILVYCHTHGLTEIPDGFVIHHINGDRKDNRPENLECMTLGEHTRLHKGGKVLTTPLEGLR